MAIIILHVYISEDPAHQEPLLSAFERIDAAELGQQAYTQGKRLLEDVQNIAEIMGAENVLPEDKAHTYMLGVSLSSISHSCNFSLCNLNHLFVFLYMDIYIYTSHSPILTIQLVLSG